MNSLTLSELTELSGRAVLDHLDRSVSIPVVDGLQAQGDLIVIPAHLLPDVVVRPWCHEHNVPRSGIELLRSEGGGNPHSLVAEHGRSSWYTHVDDPWDLSLGVLDTATVVYLLHPEHGASGIAPGRYVIGRQREAVPRSQQSSDTVPRYPMPFTGNWVAYVADQAPLTTSDRL